MTLRDLEAWIREADYNALLAKNAYARAIGLPKDYFNYEDGEDLFSWDVEQTYSMISEEAKEAKKKYWEALAVHTFLRDLRRDFNRRLRAIQPKGDVSGMDLDIFDQQVRKEYFDMLNERLKKVKEV